MATTEAQLRAAKKYQAKHKDKQKIYNYRSTARRFIKEYATAKDIAEFKKLLAQRRRELDN